MSSVLAGKTEHDEELGPYFLVAQYLPLESPKLCEFQPPLIARPPFLTSSPCPQPWNHWVGGVGALREDTSPRDIVLGPEY